MEKIVKAGLRDCTVNLDGSECAVKFDSCFRAFAVRNDGAADIYISKTSGIIPDDDGVMCVKSGASAVFAHMDIYADAVYLIGTGKVQVHAQNDSANPFNYAPTFDGGVQASGNPVTLDGLQGGVPFSEMVVSGDNIIGQNLTVNVSGKNLTKNIAESGTMSGVSVTKNADNSITLNGTATSDLWLLFDNACPLIEGVTYTFSSGLTKSTNITFGVRSEDGNIQYLGTRTYGSFVSPVTGMCRVRAFAGKDYPLNNLTIYPQLELGDTATEYEPYHGSTTTITPDTNPYTIPDDIRQQDGLNVVSVSKGELSVTGVRKNAAVKKIWDKIDELTTAIIVSNGETIE